MADFQDTDIQEIWKDVAGYDGWYQVSNLGRIRSWKNSSQPGRRKKPKILKAARSARGYLAVVLYKGEAHRTTANHIACALSFLGPPPPGYEINHKNLNKADPRLNNLEFVTRSENMLHASRGGAFVGRNHVVGQAAGRGKLTTEQVLNIRRRYAEGGITQTQLAHEFYVFQGTISDIVKRITWTHI